VYIRVSPDAPQWRLTCIYGEARVDLWDTIRNLKTQSNLPWLLIGDFNEALWQKEHFSQSPRPLSQMEAFRGFI
jgi:hypothetical protein